MSEKTNNLEKIANEIENSLLNKAGHWNYNKKLSAFSGPMSFILGISNPDPQTALYSFGFCAFATISYLYSKKRTNNLVKEADLIYDLRSNLKVV